MKKAMDTVVVGGGQAGLAISYYLKQEGREHVVLEQAERPGNAWRNGRWDSFTLVTPNWTVRMPGAHYGGDEPHGFMTCDQVVAYLEEYIDHFDLPVVYQARVKEVIAQPLGEGYFVATDDALYSAANVVVATGLFQRPQMPDFSAGMPAEIKQLHSSQYRNPESLPAGAVLVVGTGQSGAQIAEELYQSGRNVYLSVGSAGRGPRRYRGKDITEWFDLMGERKVDDLSSPRDKYKGSLHVSGTKGGHSLNLHQFARDGVNLVGRLQGVHGDKIKIAADLRDNLAGADKVERELIKMIDGYIDSAGLETPEDELPQLQDGYDVDVIRELDLTEVEITSIIWATGYAFDFNLVKLPIFDEDGYPVQKRGVTDAPGMYFLGLPWLHTQGSGLFSGVGKDAAHVAAQIASNGDSMSAIARAARNTSAPH